MHVCVARRLIKLPSYQAAKFVNVLTAGTNPQNYLTGSDGNSLVCATDWVYQNTI